MSVNKVILIGRLGKDPEVRYLPSGETVASVTLATSEVWKDKQGQKQERTEWHNLSFFGRQAEVVGQYLKKGSQIYVEGSIRTEKWQDKNTGQDRYTTKIVANSMQMLDSKSAGGGGGNGGGSYQGGGDEHFDQRPSAPAQRPAAAPSRPAAPAPAKNNFDDFDDDIPF